MNAADSSLYEYAVIRFVPRVEREEFINIGLIMMCKRRRWIRVRFHLDPARLDAFGTDLCRRALEHQLLTFTQVAEGHAAGGPMALLPVEERFRWLTAVRSACLQTGRPHPGLTTDLDARFDTLFAEQVL